MSKQPYRALAYTPIALVIVAVVTFIHNELRTDLTRIVTVIAIIAAIVSVYHDATDRKRR